jgi:cyclophilin family peptidyl-prolyl cis-trans isomerase
MKFLRRLIFLEIVCCAFWLLSSALCRGAEPPALPDGLYAEFATPHGAVTVELFADKSPLTVANFVGLAEGTLGPTKPAPYYTGLKWYRVVPGFVIQSGDPSNPGGGIQSRPADAKTSTPGYTFTDEFTPGLRHGEPGILSMANGGPDTNSAEFFITLGDDTRLNYLHSVFGRSVRGLDVLPQIKPDEAFTVKILRVGPAAQAFKADEASFKALMEKGVKYAGEADCGPTAHFDDPLKVLPTEVPRAKNFNFKLNNLQRAIGLKVYARVYPTFSPEDEKQKPADFTKKLARSLGIDQSGALAVYFADKDSWYVWVGNDLMGTFNPDHEKPMAVKNALYKTVKAKAAEYTELAKQQRGPDKSLTPADLAKYSVDAMLDLLIFQLEPKPKG